MKITQHLIVTFALFFFLFGCSSKVPNESSKHNFEIHLQSWFSNTPVKVFFDDSLVLEDTVSTGSIIGIAKIIPMNISEGKHKLRITANGSAEYEEIFEINSTLYVGVSYESARSNISFIFQNEQFYYD